MAGRLLSIRLSHPTGCIDGFGIIGLKSRSAFLCATADVEPQALLPSRIREGAVSGSAMCIVGVLCLRENFLQECAMHIQRDLSPSQHGAHDPSVRQLGVFEAQGMARQACGAQELAQPLSVP